MILGATVLANDALLPAVWAAVPAGACITDVGSTKRSIVREAERLAAERGDVHFVGSHPDGRRPRRAATAWPAPISSSAPRSS